MQAKARCKVKVQCADEAVVVMKHVPEKAGNSLEDKTCVTRPWMVSAGEGQKPASGAKGGREFKAYQKEFGLRVKALERRLRCRKVR